MYCFKYIHVYKYIIQMYMFCKISKIIQMLEIEFFLIL